MRGRRTNLILEREEWDEAKALAVGLPGNAMAFFAPIFEPSPPEHADHNVRSGYETGASSIGGAGSWTQSISPHPHTVWGGIVDSGASHMIEPTFLAFSFPLDPS